MEDRNTPRPIPNPLHRLSEQDMASLRVETPSAPAHVGAIAVLEATPLVDDSGKLRLDHIRTRLGRRLSLAPQLRRRPMFPGIGRGRTLWVDDATFDIANHVVESRLPTGAGVKELLDAGAAKWSELLDRSRPLWELRFFTGMSEGRLGVMLRLHHSFVDGVAAVALTQTLFDFQPDAPDPDPATWAPEAPPGNWSLIKENVTSRSIGLLRFLAYLPHLRRVARGFANAVHDTWLMYRFSGSAPKTSINRAVSRGRVVRYLCADLKAARSAAHLAGGKINDVALNLVAGGLHDLLQSRGELAPGIQLTAMVPVSLRPSQDATLLGNQSGALLVRLPVFEADATRRLALVITATTEAKARQHPIYMQALQSWLSLLPFSQPFIKHQRFVNLFVTNVVGPPAPMYMFGAPIKEIAPVVQLAGNVTITVCAFSYAGNLYVVTTADAQACRDVDVFRDGMVRAWRQLTAPTAIERRAG